MIQKKLILNYQFIMVSGETEMGKQGGLTEHFILRFSNQANEYVTYLNK